MMGNFAKLFMENPGAARYFYHTLGQSPEQNSELISSLIDQNTSLILFEEALEFAEINISRTELLYRYLILLSSLVPPFLFGMIDRSIVGRLLEISDNNLKISEMEGNATAFIEYIGMAVDCVLYRKSENL